MSFDARAIRELISKHGRVTRIAVADVKGSAPREVGASVIVWNDGQTGTIGGGALEFEATSLARAHPMNETRRYPLGPKLGQCCGGSVTLRFDVLDIDRLNSIETTGLFVRGDGDAPLWVERLAQSKRAAQHPVLPKFQNGWFAEDITTPKSDLWIWGAGHVGRALVDVLTPLNTYSITWVDVDASRFPSPPNPNANVVTAQNPADLVKHVPMNSEHLIVTYSHVLDLELCHQLLHRSPRFLGLIGSKTKWMRFQKRLKDLGHSPQEIDTITCPIGDPALGKHPQTIAISVAHRLLNTAREENLLQGKRTNTS